MKNIIIVSSGTGGHIYPGIALAREFDIKNKDYNPIFFISNNSVSTEILKNSKFKYIEFSMSGMPRKVSFSFILFLIKMKFTFFKALKQIIKLKPRAVIGTGGYITVPVLFAAKILRKKIFIHEQNSIPGKSNVLLSRISDKTFISFQSSRKFFKKAIVSGCPVRRDIVSASKEKAVRKLKLEDKIFTFLVFGGSLGAVKLNEIACDSLLNLSIKGKFQILHITGSKSYGEIQKKVKTNRNYRIFEYMHNIADAYAASDIIICRSGAGSVFELKVLDKPSVLVPYPYATDNHQYWNAKEIEQDGKIIIIEEKNLTKENLTNAVYILRKNIKNRAADDKAINNTVKFPQELIFEEVIECIKF